MPASLPRKELRTRPDPRLLAPTLSPAARRRAHTDFSERLKVTLPFVRRLMHRKWEEGGRSWCGAAKGECLFPTRRAIPRYTTTATTATTDTTATTTGDNGGASHRQRHSLTTTVLHRRPPPPPADASQQGHRHCHHLTMAAVGGMPSTAAVPGHVNRAIQVDRLRLRHGLAHLRPISRSFCSPNVGHWLTDGRITPAQRVAPEQWTVASRKPRPCWRGAEPPVNSRVSPPAARSIRSDRHCPTQLPCACVCTVQY